MNDRPSPPTGSPWTGQTGPDGPPGPAPTGAQPLPPTPWGPQPMPPGGPVAPRPVGPLVPYGGPPSGGYPAPYAPGQGSAAGGTPTRPQPEPWPSDTRHRGAHGDRGPGAASLVIGGVFILTGIWFLIREFAPELEPSRFWPLAIVALGLVLLLASLAGRSRRRGGDAR